MNVECVGTVCGGSVCVRYVSECGVCGYSMWGQCVCEVCE